MLKRICLILLTGALAAQAVTYSYDSAGRLVKADYGAAGVIVYVYDNAGNLVNRTAQAGAGSVSAEPRANLEVRPAKTEVPPAGNRQSESPRSASPGAR